MSVGNFKLSTAKPFYELEWKREEGSRGGGGGGEIRLVIREEQEEEIGTAGKEGHETYYIEK